MRKDINDDSLRYYNNSHLLSVSSKNIYRGKTVLVTGHTGFKGTWLSLWLEALKARVVGYSLEPNTRPSLFEETGLENKVKNIYGDIRDGDHLFDVFQNYAPEFVFHLAAQPLVRVSYRDPKLTYETNVIGFVNLLESVRETDSVRVVINVTSDKCYENKGILRGYHENDPMGGSDPYSSSKGCSELVTTAYRSSYFNPNKIQDHGVALASVRAGNVIGGGDWAQDRIIPDCIRSLIAKIPIEVRNPHAVRPWQYVLEPLSGYLWLGKLLRENGEDYASGWNFGLKENQTMTVEELVERMIQIWGEGSYILQKDTHIQPYEANYLKLDCRKVNRILKWQALYDIEEAMTKTIKWYKLFYQGNENAYNLCLEQIKSYISSAKKTKMIWTSLLDI